MYTALLLNSEDQKKLADAFSNQVPEGWASYHNPMKNWSLSHHMTINMGDASKGPAKDWLDKEAHLRVVSIGLDDKAMAVGVESDVPSVNDKKHVTIAVNPNGGKPFLSNKIENWQPVKPMTLKGIVRQL